MAQDPKREQRGTSDPLDFRNARPVGHPHKPVVPETNLQGGNLATGLPASLIVNGTAQTAEIAIAGALLVRLRGLATAGGTLSFLYLRPASARAASGSPGYSYSNALDVPHADVVVVANTEFLADIEPGGESDLLVTFTPTASGNWVFLDVMQQ